MTNTEKKYRDFTKRLNVEADNALSVKIEKNFTKDAYFADVYFQANKLVNEIKSRSNKYFDEIKKDKIDKNEKIQTESKLRVYGNNVIIFTGKRGEGKTSALQSFSYYLANGNRDKTKYSDFFTSENKNCEMCVESTDYIVLEPIDPRLLKNSNSIVRNVLSNLFFIFQDMIGEMEDGFETDNRTIANNYRDIDTKRFIKRTHYNQSYIAQIYHDFDECYNLISYIKERKNDREVSSIEDLANLGSISNLQKRIFRLIKTVLAMKFENSEIQNNAYIVVQIDDADLAEGNLYEICEDIHHYLRMPNVIVLMATNYSLLRKAIRGYYALEYKDNIYVEDKDDIVARVSKKAQEYIEKCFPIKHIIFLPSLKDDWNDNNWANIEFRYHKDNNDEKENLSNLKDFVTDLFKRKTGICLSGTAEKVFYKFRLRELISFISFFENLDDIKSVDVEKTVQGKNDANNKNKGIALDQSDIITMRNNFKRLKQYFENEWCHIHLKNNVWDIIYDYVQNLNRLNVNSNIDYVTGILCIDPQKNSSTIDFTSSSDNSYKSTEGKNECNECSNNNRTNDMRQFKDIEDAESDYSKIQFAVQMECVIILKERFALHLLDNINRKKSDTQISNIIESINDGSIKFDLLKKQCYVNIKNTNHNYYLQYFDVFAK